jgi:hypothetical protein
MTTLRRPALVLGLALALACNGSGGGGGLIIGGDGGVVGVPTPVGAPIDPSLYFTGIGYGQAGCDGDDGQLMGQRALRLFYSGAVDVPAYTRGLQRYYHRHGLSFFTDRMAAPVNLPYALDTDDAALSAAARTTFPGVNLDDPDAIMMRDPALYDRIVTFVINFYLRPVIDFAHAHNDGAGVTNLIVLPQIPSKGMSQLNLEGGGTLAGFAISPELLHNLGAADPSVAKTWASVDLPPGFSPMMFLDAGVIEKAAAFGPVLRDLIVAHEFGHTAALVHRNTPHNLMYPAVAPNVNTCTDALASDQLNTMRSTLALNLVPVTRALTAPPAAGEGVRGVSPAQLRGLLHGDGRALRALLEPLHLEL